MQFEDSRRTAAYIALQRKLRLPLHLRQMLPPKKFFFRIIFFVLLLLVAMVYKCIVIYYNIYFNNYYSSHLSERGTIHFETKGAGAWAPPPPCARHQSPFRPVVPLGRHRGNACGQLFRTNKTRLLSKWMGRESELHFHWSPAHKILTLPQNKV